MQIENIALLELFMQTICEVSEKETQWLESPVLTETSTLSQQLANSMSIIENLAIEYENRGEVKLALATRQIASALSEKDLLSLPGKEVNTRLLDYVYPIV